MDRAPAIVRRAPRAVTGACFEEKTPEGNRYDILFQPEFGTSRTSFGPKVVEPGRVLVSGLTTVDHYGVDGIVEGGSAGVGGLAGAFRKAQTGFVRSYALSLLAGVLLVIVTLMAVNFA